MGGAIRDGVEFRLRHQLKRGAVLSFRFRFGEALVLVFSQDGASLLGLILADQELHPSDARQDILGRSVAGE